ncbi:MAG: hypothetical protein PWR10_1932 [Halanaerobiales bacterium]|nr:hypothetical protein [Halanaerobiales bacterium]
MELPPRLYHWLVRPGWFTKKFISKVIGQDLNFDNKKVLDFGCGIGSSCFMFTPKNYLGIDPDHRRINYARYLYPNYHFKTIKGKKLNTPDNTFDYILIIAVLHHIKSEELPGIMHEFHRVLKPDGNIIVMEPCFYPGNYLNNFLMDLFDRGNYIRNADDYLQMFYLHNFRINNVKRIKKLFYNEVLFSAAPDSS